MPETEITLQQAVLALDPAIDAHWTKDGKPNLNALKEALGRRVTRGELDPTLTRETSAGAALDKGLDDQDDTPEPFDFVGALDEVFGNMTNDHRIYAEALYRLSQYYRSERFGIEAQLKNARARGRL